MPDTLAVNAPTEKSKQVSLSRVGEVAEKSGLPILLVALILFFSFSSSTGDVFTSTPNIQNIIANQSVAGLIALGMVIPLVAGYFDLSVAAIAGLSNVAVASLIATHHVSVPIGLLGGLLIGVVAGGVNGLLVGGLRLNPFITTFGMYIIIGGLLQLYTKGQIISGMPNAVGEWSSGKWFGIARPFWLLIVVALVVWYVLVQTPFGRKLAAIGSNEGAARLAGIRVDRSVFLIFVLSGMIAGVAGALLTVRTGSADSTTAMSTLFPALAAVFLGQTSINPGQPNVWGTIFGVFVVAVAVNGFTLMGADSWITQVFNGGALLLSVMISSFMAKARERRASTIVLRASKSADG